MKRDGRLASDDWTCFNGKTRVAFNPKQMTPEELFSGDMWFPPTILLLPIHAQADGGVANESRLQPPREPGVQMVTVEKPR
jgi:hypothetical protein